MKSRQVLQKLEFGQTRPEAEPLYVDKNGRVILFSLRPGQSLKEHNVPTSPFYVVVLKGRGVFAGGDGREQTFGPDSLLIFDPGEEHTVRALDEELVFVGFLHGAPSNASEKVGGVIGHQTS